MKSKQKLQAIQNNSQDNYDKQIEKAVIQYQQKIDFDVEIDDEDQNQQQQQNQITQQIIEVANKKTMKPITMFKDIMTLKKQNMEKKVIINELTLQNDKLRKQYQQCVNTNKKIQLFLKQIENAFKCDQFSRKTNQIMNQTKKTLYRQAKQSQNYMKKIIKSASANSIQQHKIYITGLFNEKRRLNCLVEKAKQQNQKKRSQEDYNQNHITKFEKAWEFIREIINNQILKSIQKRNTYKKQKLIVVNGIKVKQIQSKKQQNDKLLNQIQNYLIKKEGLEYQKDILKKRKKQKSKLQQQINKIHNSVNNKNKIIAKLQKQLKEKRKSYQYMIKLQEKLKAKFQQQKKQYNTKKKDYQDTIAKLSSTYEIKSQSYRNMMFQELSVKSKRQAIISTPKNINNLVVKKVRIVRLQEIKYISRRLALHILINGQQLKDYIKNKIIKKTNFISLGQIKQNFSVLKIGLEEEVQKLSRYIIEDNTVSYVKVDIKTKIQVSLAQIILKNLLKTELKNQQFQSISQQAKSFFNLHYDSIRQELYLASGKSQRFDMQLLLNILQKRIRCQSKSTKITQIIQIIILKNNKQVLYLSFKHFDQACEELLGKKLVKEKKIEFICV